MVYTQGLQIYSAVDKKAQQIAEDVVYNSKVLDGDKKLDLSRNQKRAYLQALFISFIFFSLISILS